MKTITALAAAFMFALVGCASPTDDDSDVRVDDVRVEASQSGAHTAALPAYCDSYTNYCATYCDGNLSCTVSCTKASPCYVGKL